MAYQQMYYWDTPCEIDIHDVTFVRAYYKNTVNSRYLDFGYLE